MKKQDAMQEIETIRARLSELERIVQEEEKPKGLWRPEVGRAYGRVLLSGEVDDYTCHDQAGLDKVIAHGDCFPTTLVAEKAAPLFARAHTIIQAALQVDPDAGEFMRPERVWTAFFDIDIDEWAVVYMQWSDYGGAHVHTREQAEQMAAILNAEGV